METKYITLENALKAVNDRIEELEKKHGPLRPSTKIGIWGVKYYLLDIPTEDVAPIVRGKWVYDGTLGYKGESNYKCSICGKRAKEKECNGRLVGGYGAEAIGSKWICDYKPDFTNYCPECGAKMEESREIQ